MLNLYKIIILITTWEPFIIYWKLETTLSNILIWHDTNVWIFKSSLLQNKEPYKTENDSKISMHLKPHKDWSFFILKFDDTNANER